MQTQADIIGAPVKRPRCIETTAMGAAYLAGLATGYWKSREEVKEKLGLDQVFLNRPLTKKSGNRRSKAGIRQCAVLITGQKKRSNQDGEDKDDLYRLPERLSDDRHGGRRRSGKCRRKRVYAGVCPRAGKCFLFRKYRGIICKTA